MIEELTAFHEAGHAYAALYLGGIVRSVSIDPDRDDGPERTGDTVVIWNRRQLSEREILEKSALVALAGPVAEMIYRDQPAHPALVAEWRHDWETAVQALQFIAQHQRRLAWIEASTADLYQTFREEQHWAAIGAIADNLLAHEILDREMLEEIADAWLS